LHLTRCSDLVLLDHQLHAEIGVIMFGDVSSNHSLLSSASEIVYVDATAELRSDSASATNVRAEKDFSAAIETIDRLATGLILATHSMHKFREWGDLWHAVNSRHASSPRSAQDELLIFAGSTRAKTSQT
jgi:hypothetical protein